MHTKVFRSLIVYKTFYHLDLAQNFSYLALLATQNYRRAFQSPTIGNDVHVFDQYFGLPDPTLNIYTPEGTPGNADTNDEVSLDVELAHAVAPRATIDLVLARSLSIVDPANATAFIVNNNLGDVFTESIGVNETASLAYDQVVHQLFVQATAKHISLFASSGDTGAAQPDPVTRLPVLAVGYPASDPLVTSAGVLHCM